MPAISDAKSDLLGRYVTALNRIQITYASMVLWSYDSTPDYFETLHQGLSLKLRPFPTVSELIRDNDARKFACEQLYDSVHRAALNDLLPLTKAYCSKTNQLPHLRTQPWFPLWSLLRNCFAHELKFNFNPHEQSLLPVSWSGVTIDVLMNGKHLTHGQCSREKMRELICEAYSFIHNDLA